MKVILLAAGQSKRVQPIEDKNFIKFCGKYLIQHQIENLLEAGFKDFIIVGNKNNLNRLQEFCRTINEEKKEEEFSATVVEQKDLKAGMAGAILEVQEFINKYEPIMIVSSNDIVDKSAYMSIFKASSNETFDSFILGRKVKEYFPGGYLEIIKHPTNKNLDIIFGIKEKPEIGKEPSDMVNVVIHFHRNPYQLFDYLKKVKTKRDDRYEVALDNMIKDGKKMQAVAYDGFWQPIKYPWHIFPVFKFLLLKSKRRISKKATILKEAIIKGEVIIEDGAKILEGAIISGPAYIGKNVVVANNALVRESNLEANCVVGYSTEVARSVLGENVWMHSNYIGDSVIGNDCAFGAGAVTGNLRLDEQHIKIDIAGEKVDSGNNKIGLICGDKVRVGINTSLMPGVRIGANSILGSGLVINQDIPENSFVKGTTKLEIRKNKTEPDQNTREKMRRNLK